MASGDILQSVFIMWYVPKGDEYMEKAILIGVYRTESDCRCAIDRLKAKPGFRDHDGWLFEEHALDKDHWTDGFITIEEALSECDNNPNSD